MHLARSSAWKRLPVRGSVDADAELTMVFLLVRSLSSRTECQRASLDNGDGRGRTDDCRERNDCASKPCVSKGPYSWPCSG